MKKLLLLSLLAYASSALSQQTLFFENFESGSSQWTVNEGYGTNKFILNNIFNGGSIIPNTPQQPAEINNAPTSYYMHIYNESYAELLEAYNAYHIPGNYSDRTITQIENISTIDMTNVTLSFWFICGGYPGLTEGRSYYSTDDGQTWNLIDSHHTQLTWTQVTYTLPEFDNQANLKFKFQWINGDEGAYAEPALGLDDILVVGTPPFVSVINDIELSNTDPWCFGTEKTIDVTFDALGSYNTDNVFTAQLSDENGDFDTPLSIGSLTSDISGVQTINATIPATTAIGSNYRIRVVSSNEVVTSEDNGIGLVINPLPVVNFPALATTCVYHSDVELISATPTGGTYSGIGVTAGMFSNSTAGVGTHVLTYTYEDVNGCSTSATSSITVDECASVNNAEDKQISVYPNPATDQLYISGDGIQSVAIFDLLGNIVATFKSEQNSYTVSNLKGGTYLVKVTSDKGIKTFKVLVK